VSFTEDVETAIAMLLAAGGAGVYHSDGSAYAATDLGITHKRLADQPPRQIALTHYPVAASPANNTFQGAVQVRSRGSEASGDVDTIGDAAYSVLHGLEMVTSNGNHVLEDLASIGNGPRCRRFRALAAVRQLLLLRRTPHCSTTRLIRPGAGQVDHSQHDPFNHAHTARSSTMPGPTTGTPTIQTAWRLDVDQDLTSGGGTWLQLKGAVALAPVINPSTGDTTDFDSAGWGGDSVTLRKAQVTGTVQRKLYTGAFDPGQEFLRNRSEDLAQFHYRIYERFVNGEAYDGWATLAVGSRCRRPG